MVKKHLQKSSRHTENDWAVLFRKCVFDIRHIAQKSSTDPVLYKDILCLKNFTGKWLPDKFWQDILTLRDEYIADRHYQQQFDSYNITLNVPYYGAPVIYKGAADLVQPNPDKLGLFDIVNVCKKSCDGFYVRANADSPKDAELALKFGAEGVGLCRTEHMFFNEDRINLFRSMILSENAEERSQYLEKLKKYQTK